MDPLTAAGISGAGVIGNILSTNSANTAAANMSQDQMEFQEQMSNTAYQRSTQDMEKAGINPMLAYQNGGASTPSGAQAPVQAANIGGAISSGFDTAIGMKNAQTQSDLADANVDQAETNVDNLSADTENKKIQGGLMSLQKTNTAADIESKGYANKVMAETLDSQIKKAKAEGDFAQVNQIMGVINSGANSANALWNPLKGAAGPIIDSFKQAPVKVPYNH